MEAQSCEQGESGSSTPLDLREPARLPAQRVGSAPTPPHRPTSCSCRRLASRGGSGAATGAAGAAIQRCGRAPRSPAMRRCGSSEPHDGGLGGHRSLPHLPPRPGCGSRRQPGSSRSAGAAACAPAAGGSRGAGPSARHGSCGGRRPNPGAQEGVQLSRQLFHTCADRCRPSLLPQAYHPAERCLEAILGYATSGGGWLTYRQPSALLPHFTWVLHACPGHCPVVGFAPCGSALPWLSAVYDASSRRLVGTGVVLVSRHAGGPVTHGLSGELAWTAAAAPPPMHADWRRAPLIAHHVSRTGCTFAAARSHLGAALLLRSLSRLPADALRQVACACCY